MRDVTWDEEALARRALSGDEEAGRQLARRVVEVKQQETPTNPAQGWLALFEPADTPKGEG